MAFVANTEQQLTTDDRTLRLNPTELRYLERSWAREFGDDLFPLIDEEPFAVLYSERDSRPNTPVNVVVGGLILKELMHLSDDDLVEAIHLDIRFKYALHLTSVEVAPVSDKTFTRFRRRCYEHELESGEDLFRQCVRGMASGLAKFMGITGEVRRMDSMMIASNIRDLGRDELIYECVANVCRWLKRNEPSLLPEGLARYADRNDFNRTFYHDGETPAEERTRAILADADRLLDALAGAELPEDPSGRLALLVRALEEQTIVVPAAAAGAGGDGADNEPDAEADASGADEGAPHDADEAATAGAECADGHAVGDVEGSPAGDGGSSGGDATPAPSGGDDRATGGNEGAPAPSGDVRSTADGIVATRTDRGEDAGTTGCIDDARAEGGEDGTADAGTTRRMRAREDGMPAGSGMLQSPYDPDASYRTKAGRHHKGFVANFEECCGERGTIVTNYQYAPNNASDPELLRQCLEEDGVAEGGALLVADGAYDGEGNIGLARDMGVELVTTSLSGRDPEDCMADCRWSDDRRELLACPAGNRPNRCSCDAGGRVRASFDRATCEGCPLLGRCGCRLKKRVAVLCTSHKATRRAEHRRRMGTEEFKDVARLRNGAETVPSMMRRNLDLSTLPRGTVRGKLFFGAKVAALNFRKYLCFRRGTARIAENPLLRGGSPAGAA